MGVVVYIYQRRRIRLLDRIYDFFVLLEHFHIPHFFQRVWYNYGMTYVANNYVQIIGIWSVIS